MTTNRFCDILFTMEVVTMIYRPLYVDKIMAYADTPFVKILTPSGIFRLNA